MTQKFLLALVLGSLFTAVSEATPKQVGSTCRQNTDKPKVIEIEKQNSGDLVVRISGYGLFGGALPQARSLEAILHLSNCQPESYGHWMDGSSYTCVGPDEPTVRDANGEQLPLPAAFKKVYFKSWMDLRWPKIYNTFVYNLVLTTENGDLEENDSFDTDRVLSTSECKLRYSNQ